MEELEPDTQNTNSAISRQGHPVFLWKQFRSSMGSERHSRITNTGVSGRPFSRQEIRSSTPRYPFHTNNWSRVASSDNLATYPKSGICNREKSQLGPDCSRKPAGTTLTHTRTLCRTRLWRGRRWGLEILDHESWSMPNQADNNAESICKCSTSIQYFLHKFRGLTRREGWHGNYQKGGRITAIS